MKAFSCRAGAERAPKGWAPGRQASRTRKSAAFSTSQTDIEITREEDFTRILQMEEEYIQQLCEDIVRLKPDVVITEKGISGRTPFAFPPGE